MLFEDSLFLFKCMTVWDGSVYPCGVPTVTPVGKHIL